MFDCQDNRHRWYRPKFIANHKGGTNLKTAEIARVIRRASKNLQEKNSRWNLSSSFFEQGMNASKRAWYYVGLGRCSVQVVGMSVRLQIPSLKLEEAEYLRVQKQVDDRGRTIKMTEEPSLPAQGVQYP